VAAASGELGEHAGSVAKEIPERNTYCQHLKEMKLPVQEIQKDAAKCLILLGSRGQKTGKTEFGVELGCPNPFVADNALILLSISIGVH
jgi:hypothetical protein